MIAIAGLKNAGKSTAADMLLYIMNTPKFMHSYTMYKLIGGFNYKYKITSFASALKRSLAALLNVPVSYFENRAFKENTYIKLSTMEISSSPTDTSLSDVRFNKMLQTEDIYKIKDSFITIRQLMQFWGTSIMRKYFGEKLWIYLSLNDDNLIISDLRFIIEAEEIKKNDGTIIYIDNPNCSIGNHVSEKEVLEMLSNNTYDYIIDNDKSLKDLFNKLKVLKPCLS